MSPKEGVVNFYLDCSYFFKYMKLLRKHRSAQMARRSEVQSVLGVELLDANSHLSERSSFPQSDGLHLADQGSDFDFRFHANDEFPVIVGQP